MKTRLITAFVAILGVIALLFGRATVALPIVAALLCALAAHEIFKATHNKNNVTFYVASIVYLAASPFIALSYVPFLTMETWSILFALAFAVGLLVHFHAEDLLRQFVCFGMAVIVAYGIGCTVAAMRAEHGVYLFFVGGLCSLMCDAGAYFAGTFFGKHKLCPAISPKKTVEGAVGGVVSVCVSVLILALIYTLCVPDAKVQYLSLMIFTPIGTVIGMVGDLFASSIKRCYGVKDFGTFFPGHGGVLDRVDSVILVFPVMMIFHALFPLIA